MKKLCKAGPQYRPRLLSKGCHSATPKYHPIYGAPYERVAAAILIVLCQPLHNLKELVQDYHLFGLLKRHLSSKQFCMLLLQMSRSGTSCLLSCCSLRRVFMYTCTEGTYTSIMIVTMWKLSIVVLVNALHTVLFV